MIDPPQVRPEEPTAVTPHGGIRGGESQQWLSYPTDLHVRFDERGVETGTTGDLVRHRQTKGAATDMVDLKPPASHSDSTMNSHSHGEGWMAEMARTRPLIVAPTKDCPWHSRTDLQFSRRSKRGALIAG
jgi:hypothetical protein